MGQYYRPVVTQKDITTIFYNRTALLTEEDKVQQARNPYYNYHGLKITEHSWWENSFVKGVIGRLYNKKGRLAWIGDYSDDEVFSNDNVPTPLSPRELYAGNMFARKPDGSFAKDERGYVIELENEPLPSNIKKYKGLLRYNPNFTLNNKVIINLTRKEYVECNAYYKRSIDDDGWCLNPLPLLTSTGGDRGGGDYHSSCICANEVGRWAYDEIIIKDSNPARISKLEKDGFVELKVIFNESRQIPVQGVV